MEPESSEHVPATPAEQAGAKPGENERIERVAALARLAAVADAISPAPAPSHGSPQATTVRAHRARLRAIGLVLLVVVLIGAGYAAFALRAKSATGNTAIPAVVIIDLSAAHLMCPSALVWSPDGSRVGVWGSSSSCDQSQTPSVVLYDARTGHVQRAVNLANLLAASQHVGTVSALTWSPDAQHLVALLDIGATQSGDPPRQILMLYPLDGNAPRFSTPALVTETGQLIWNVRDVSAANLPVTTLPSALSYHWSAQGGIAPEQVFPPASASGGAAAPVAFTGRPAPRDGFTFWQSGSIDPVWPVNPTNPNNGPDKSQPPAAEQFTATPILWSPNGQWVTFDPLLQGVVALHAQSSADAGLCLALRLAASCQPTVVPLPDAALVTVAQAAEQPVKFSLPDGRVLSDYRGVPVVWSPNGKALATMLPPDQFSGVTHTTQSTVSLLSTSTGRSLTRLTYQCPLRNDGCGNPALSWSPRGQQLAGLDRGTGFVTIWNTQQYAG